MDEDKKWCPMAAYEDTMRGCVEGKCAWWLEDRGCCAIVALGGRTTQFETIINEVRE